MMLEYATGLAAEEVKHLRRTRYQDRYQDGSRTPLALRLPSMTVLSKQGEGRLALEKAISKYRLLIE